MYPFWEIAIAPVIEAVAARRIVEIGALRGETTVRMLERLGPRTELHVIDPLPEFDPAEHERRFPGRYIFHRDISHNVLPRLGAMDVALVDGDHNWFTVYHELQMLSRAARKARKPLPVLVMHDVGWPYGRRDLYYEPDRIPEEFRHPYDRRGMRPDRRKLLPRGGLNPRLANAIAEGGPRNGVMTALDDFEREYDRPLRRILLPIYFGLAIVAEHAQLERHPALGRVLDALESADGRARLLELAESLRIDALVTMHNVFYGSEERTERAARRYLDLLKGTLLDEHYIEHEARLRYLAQCVEQERPVLRSKLVDPARNMPNLVDRLVNARRTGPVTTGKGEGASTLPYTDMGRTRLDRLHACLDSVRKDDVPGDLVECGTRRGGGAMFMRGYLDAHEMPGRTVWLADTFPGADTDGRSLLDVSTDVNLVREGFERLGLLDERVRFLQGEPAETLPDSPIEQVALLRVGGGLGRAVEDVLEALYDAVAPGGFVVVDDYTTAAGAAVDAFRARRGVREPLERVDASAVVWRKQEPAAVPAARPIRRLLRRRIPLAPPAPARAKELSVVVVFHDMRREAQRTLHSLSRAYQQGVDDLDYEVIAVDNGSRPDQRLTDDLVQGFGREFRLLELGDRATKSPADALNRGLEVAAGRTVAFMVDGAHLLTPGVLRFGMTGIRTYAPAIVATQLWYVGPGQQNEAARAGYDQRAEDRLFKQIHWPIDGYRLFDIGHFVGERDWFDSLWESNCLFVPRALLEQVGAFDESFTMPGGGFANLDFFERVAHSPDVNLVTILGEGSFHQFHGGTTTNLGDERARRGRIASYAEHYGELRRRDYQHPGKTIHYVGAMRPSALRTRRRRMSARAFVDAAAAAGDGPPESRSPIPDDAATEFVDAFWHSMVWTTSSWLGVPVTTPPTDLMAYQELVERVRPDVVVETGTGAGGRALFLASVCELVGHGRVVSVGDAPDGARPRHPRLHYVTGPPTAPATVDEVRRVAGDAGRALVVLGSTRDKDELLREFEAYESLVPVGSYVVVENTVVNGNPVWPGFGPGPAEAARTIVGEHGGFEFDRDLERYGLTFNRGGFLRRVE